MTEQEVVSVPPPIRRATLWRRFCTHPGAVIGAVILALIALAVVIGPLIWQLDPAQIDIRAKNQGPSLAHPLGTDQLGRDLLAALLSGGRVSLLVGLVAIALAVSLGTLIGVAAGVFRHWDAPLMRLTDLFLSLPLLPLLLVAIMLWRDSLRAQFGPEVGMFLLIVCAIGLTSWMQTARIVRGEVLALREREFIMAATALGTRPFAMIRRHILPNILGPIVVSATLGVGHAILTESALSFLGLGFPSDVPSWGRMLFDGTNYMTLTPARVVWPGLAISLTVLSVNYIGDGLRDALDPRRQRRAAR
ncbi:peptide/nickel transport system permease protein [Aliiroseovarius sediminilitoris]|uniref:Peptide/nickel transport system permease protein n=1 Tax=Aliiroseovarius sediminilitoris TaxID=1173584 RepID=A0A1I0P7F9_9RHOB|nr:ABC transporter permease [Aliiroseovarius sediminilitoris]SEW10013.1 peptide/nickel transport system permease protein [Aliiroseovarius sediminilitoris]